MPSPPGGPKAKDAGFDLLYAKPVEFRELRLSVERLLGLTSPGPVPARAHVAGAVHGVAGRPHRAVLNRGTRAGERGGGTARRRLPRPADAFGYLAAKQ